MKALKAKAARVEEIIAGLQKTYPEAHCVELLDPLELLAATLG